MIEKAPQPNDPQKCDAWFLKGREADIMPGKTVQIRSESYLKYYIECSEAYNAMAHAIETAKNKDHYIFLSAWTLDLDTFMTGKSGRKKIYDLLEEATKKRGVNLCVLLNEGQGSAPSNKDVVEILKKLPQSNIILDSKYAVFGTHHQKILLVAGEQNLIGFVGGMDIENPRQGIFYDKNSLIDKVNKTAFHDVHCEISGPIADDLLQGIVDRIKDNQTAFYLPKFKTFANNSSIQSIRSKSQVTSKPPNSIQANSPWKIKAQIVHTYFNSRKFPFTDKIFTDRKDEKDKSYEKNLDDIRIPLKKEVYKFAPNGNNTIYYLLRNAIRNAKNFIYVEDQYFINESDMGIGPSIFRLLADKVKQDNFKALVIFTTNVSGINIEMFQTWARRKKFRSLFTDESFKKVSICTYRAGVTDAYLHSKTWIFDDEFAIVGSANCNRRGYSHDSEVGIGIADLWSPGVVQSLRIDLWYKHINAYYPATSKFVEKISRAQLIKFSDGLKYWSSPAANLGIVTYEFEPATWQKGDPNVIDHSLLDDPRLDTDPRVQKIKKNPKFYDKKKNQIKQIIYPDWEWNTIIDPDGS